MTIRLSKAAEDDLIAIYVYSVAQFGSRQAETYQDKIDAALALLAQFPKSARLRGEITPPVRVHPVGSHIIVYVDDDAGIRVLRVRHQRENWA